MKPPKTSLLLTTVHFSARTGLAHHFAARLDDIARHHGRFERIRLSLTRESPSHADPYFAACARLERPGTDLITHAAGAEPETAGDRALEKLARLVADHSRRRRHVRRHPEALDRGAHLRSL